MKYLFLLGLFLLFWSYCIEPNILIIKKFQFDYEPLKGKRFVFATDLHIKPYEKKRLIKLVKKINSQKPNYVFLGGDYVNGHKKGNTLPITDIAKELKNIDAPTFGVIGNHDGWQGKEEIIQAMQANDIKILVNENVKVENFYIAGLDDMQTGKPDVEKTLANAYAPLIVLTHSPDMFPSLPEHVTLTLAGHVHGGQIVFPFMKPFIVPSKYGKKYAYGMIKENNNVMFISKGLGTSILPLRFNCAPEIVVIDFT